jgi:hypothetical protein
MVGRLALKLLAAKGAVTGRNISAHIKLSFPMVESVLNYLRKEQLVGLKGDAIAGDYSYVISQNGLALAKDMARECTYFGAAPRYAAAASIGNEISECCRSNHPICRSQARVF